MHLKITKIRYKGEIRKYAKVVESYRDEKGVVRKRIIMNLGRIKTDEDLKGAYENLEKIRIGKRFFTTDEIKIEEHLDFGVLYVCNKLLEEYGVKEVLRKFNSPRIKYDFEEISSLLIINRLSDPGSELNCLEWLKGIWFEKKYETKIGEQHLYRCLDRLIKNKAAIEKEIFQKLKGEIGKIKTVFYDLTSSYFESRNESELKKFGYSRDKIRGKRQILLGLVIANEMPIAHFLFPGNVADKKTVEETLTYLQKNFGVTNVIFVVDRGMFSRYNLQFLEENGFKYIISTKRRKNELIRRLMSKDIKKNAEEVYREGKKRYILCFNEEEKIEDIEEIEFTVKEFLEALSRNKRVALARRRTRPMLRRLFDPDGNLRKDVYEYEKKIAGKFLLVTTTSLLPKKCYSIYKGLSDIEESFREIKSFLRLRPFYHRESRRIRAHAFVCVLAYLLECLIRRRLGIPVRRALNELRLVRVSIHKFDDERVGILNELREEQENIFKRLQIEVPKRFKV